MNTEQWLMQSELCALYLVASEKGLHGIYWEKKPGPLLSSLKNASSSPAIKILSRTVSQLEEYFAGKRQKFDLPLDAAGTEFQKRVWTALSKIPYGKTCSYRDIARKLGPGMNGAARAVGTANGRNPLSIVVPCHRVIASDGSLGGYAGGLAIKNRLLELEQRQTLNRF